eukprot:438657-Prorocentrum_minimum.AAC.1
MCRVSSGLSVSAGLGFFGWPPPPLFALPARVLACPRAGAAYISNGCVHAPLATSAAESAPCAASASACIAARSRLRLLSCPTSFLHSWHSCNNGGLRAFSPRN